MGLSQARAPVAAQTTNTAVRIARIVPACRRTRTPFDLPPARGLIEYNGTGGEMFQIAGTMVMERLGL